MSKVRIYVFTLNNYTDEELRTLDTAVGDQVRYIRYGKEVGESGTPHLQGMIAFFNRVRLPTVKKVLGPRAHVEPMRGTIAQNIAYTGKDGVLTEFGDRPRTNEEKSESGRNKHAEAFELAKQGRLDEIEPGMRLRYYNTFEQIASKSAPLKYSLKGDYRSSPWRDKILAMLELPPDDRTIIWVYDTKGGSGKSYFARWLANNKGAWLMRAEGTNRDMVHSYRPECTICIVDIPRECEKIPYGFFECVKDGAMHSTKYSTKMMSFDPPHLLVFANVVPNVDLISKDRLKIFSV